MAGPGGEGGVPDMTVISDIDEHGINRNLQKRYKNNKIYVSVYTMACLHFSLLPKQIVTQTEIVLSCEIISPHLCLKNCSNFLVRPE